jgi:hypothetical protein
MKRQSANYITLHSNAGSLVSGKGQVNGQALKLKHLKIERPLLVVRIEKTSSRTMKKSIIKSVQVVALSLEF